MNKVNSGNNFENQYIYLMDNINLENQEWDVIGSYTDDTTNKAFAGIFEGNNRTIKGLNINKNQDSLGLFVYNTGTIRDIILESGSITGNARVAGITAINKGTIENCHNKGVTINMTGSSTGGAGIVSRNAGNISYCSNSTDINNENAAYVGGIVGANHGEVSSSYNVGKIEGKYDIGGIAGQNAPNGIIKFCFNTGNIIGNGIEVTNNTTQVGGLAGINSGRINFCYNTGTIECAYFNGGGIAGLSTSAYDENAGIFNCYNIGIIENKGSILGNISGGSYSPVKNCYFSREITDLDGVSNTNENSDIEVYEKTLSYMKTNSFVNDLNKYEEVFTINSELNDGYPVLKWQCE